MIQLAVAFVAVSLIGAQGAHRLVPVPMKCQQRYEPSPTDYNPTSSEKADMMERGQLKGEYIIGRAVLEHGRPVCDFGRYMRQTGLAISDPCAVDPNDGTQFLCQIDERLAPGGSLAPH